MTGSRSLSFSTSRRPTRRRGVRVALTLLGLLLVLAVLAALTGALLWGYAWARLGGTSLPSLAASGNEALGAGGATAPAGTTTVLVGLTAATPAEGGGTPLAGPVALVQVGGPRGDDAAVVVLPPELPVSVEGEAPMALAEVHAAGGPDLLLRTVVDYTQIAVDHVVLASVDALPSLVEALGPVPGCPVSTPVSGACPELDVEAARAAVAALTAADAAPADVGAAVRDLAAVVRGLATRTDGPLGVLTSPLATRRAIAVVDREVTTDVDLRGATLLPIADRLAAAREVGIATLPGVVHPDTGELVVLPEQAATRFALLRDGGVATTTAADDEAALLGEASVVVLNGTGTAGYAASLETQLAALGVRVVGTDNAASFDVERTEVAYAADDPAAEATAVLLARELGDDAELVPLDRTPTFEGEPVTVQVTGGADLDTGADASDDQEP